MTITIAVLGHHDRPRFERAIRSAEFAAMMLPGTRVLPVVDLEGDLDYETKDTRFVLGGSAGKAKAALLELWAHDAKSDDFVYQLDGDDIIYPCAALAMDRDVRMARPGNLIGYYGFDVPASDTMWDCVAAPSWVLDAPTAVAEDWDYDPYVVSWMPRLWDRKAVDMVDWEHDMKAYEDGMVCYHALYLHLQGQMSVCVSGAVDILAVDKETPDSTQKSHDMLYWSAELKRRREKYLTYENSDWGSLDCILPEPLMDMDSRKEAWQGLNTLEQ